MKYRFLGVSQSLALCALVLIIGGVARADMEDGLADELIGNDEDDEAVQYVDAFADAPAYGFPWEAGGANEANIGGLNLVWGGALFSVAHYRMQPVERGTFYDRQVLDSGFARAENTLKLRMDAQLGRAIGVVDIDFVWLLHRDQIQTVGDLRHRQDFSLYRWDVHALYVEVTDLLFEGLDLRLGQQLVQWGKGDQFNPTNTINSFDLENILLFGRQQANWIARLDYAIDRSWSFSAVLVPIFKPAILPPGATLGAREVDRLPFVSDSLRHRLHTERELARQVGYPTIVGNAHVELPEPKFSNAQWAVRLAGNLFNQDIAFSYYRGRFDFPIPMANIVTQVENPTCHPDDTAQCIDGFLQTDVTVGFPRMQVVGLNMEGELNLLSWLFGGASPLGYRLEFGLYVPERQTMTLTQGEITMLGINRPAGEYDYHLGGARPAVVESTPFAKWVVGLDYSLSRHVYVNAMWVHGMPDEFGASSLLGGGWAVRAGGVDGNIDRVLQCVIEDSYEKCAEETLRRRIGDYVVFGFDIQFLDAKGLFRLFSILDVGGIYHESYDSSLNRRVRRHTPFYRPEGFAATILPQLQYNFGDGFLLAVGALLQLGESYTKFGDPAGGGSLAWMTGTYTF